MTSLEICVDSVESAIAAESGGADRVELCSALIEGGLTPSLGLIRAVRANIDIGLHVMIRPRGGDFLYSAAELSVMRDDIAVAAAAGAEGVVFGVLTADAEIDVAQNRKLVELARPMQVTFHRAIDLTRDVQAALEDAIRTGADRILTSGGEQTALLGSERIANLVRAANGRILLMAGGGVRPENIELLIKSTAATEFHAALRSPVASPVKQQAREVHLGDPGVDDYTRSVVRVEDVRELRQALDRAVAAPVETPA